MSKSFSQKSNFQFEGVLLNNSKEIHFNLAFESKHLKVRSTFTIFQILIWDSHYIRNRPVGIIGISLS